MAKYKKPIVCSMETIGVTVAVFWRLGGYIKKVAKFVSEPIEVTDSPITLRPAVWSIQLPSGSKTTQIFHTFHVESDGTVRNFDGSRIPCNNMALWTFFQVS